MNPLLGTHNRFAVSDLSLWILAVCAGLVIAGAALLDETMIGAVPDPAVRVFCRAALIAAACAAVFSLLYRRKQPAPSERIEQRLQAMQEFIQITFDIVSELDREKLIKSIAERAAALMGAPFAVLLLNDREKDVLFTVAQTDFPKDFTGLGLVRGEGVAGTVWETGQPVIVDCIQTWSRRSLKFDATPLVSLVGIPLKWEGEIIGSLTIGDTAPQRKFSDADVRLLQPFADLASIAINNSAIFSEALSRTDELEKRDTVKTETLAATQEELLQKTIQLQGLLKRMTQIQEDERARIARDMHDSTTQLILGAIFAAQAMRTELECSSSAQAHMQTLLLLLNQIESEIRVAIRDLRPIILDQAGIAIALEQYVEQAASLSGLDCDFNLQGSPRRLTDEMEIAIYRIVQEALQNVTNHARAQRVGVTLQFRDQALNVVVEDDGMGFNPAEKGLTGMNEFGLIGMQERAESIGAEIQVTSRLGKGTRLDLVVLYPAAETLVKGM